MSFDRSRTGAAPVRVLSSIALAIALMGCNLGGRGSGVESPVGSADAGPPTPGTALTACEVVEPHAISRVLQAALGERVEVSEGALRESPNALSPAHTTCSYRGDDWGELEVDLTPDDGVGFYDAALAAAEDALVLEIGDGAFWSKDTERGLFRKGSVTVMLQFSGLARKVNVRDVTVAVGRRAMNRL